MVDTCGGEGGGSNDSYIISSLTNKELAERLKKDFGYVCGPITPSTRSVYEKKLANCIKENGMSRASDITPNKSRISGRPSIRLRPSLPRRWEVTKDIIQPKTSSPVFQSTDQTEQHSFYGQPDKSLETISEWTSLSIVGVFLLFFSVIVTFYLYSRLKFRVGIDDTLPQSLSNFGVDLNDLSLPVCSQHEKQFCVNSETRFKPSLLVLRYMLNHIEEGLLDFYCSKEPQRADAHIYTQDEIFKALQAKSSEIDEKIRHLMLPNDGSEAAHRLLFAEYFNDALALIARNSVLKINLVDNQGGDKLIKVDKAYPIHLPLICKVKVFLWETGKVSLLLVGVVLLIGAIYKYTSHRKKMETEEQRAVSDLVRKCIELLQSPDEPHSMPVINIRDTLLTPQQKKDARWKKIWSNVVNYIEKNEYHVKATIEEINGEEFKTWKWCGDATSFTPREYFSNSSMMAGSTDGSSNSAGSRINTTVMKTGSIEWQGSAFGSSEGSSMEDNSSAPTLSRGGSCNGSGSRSATGKHKALTRFLKIRNIPNKDPRNTPDWKSQIRNAILQKCSAFAPDGHHGILHLDIGGSDTNESPIYMKCDSMDSATNAFNALHGWWCERNLVSVKFLKDERYYERFPEAARAETPLQLLNPGSTSTTNFNHHQR